jgi:hypothetical protein
MKPASWSSEILQGARGKIPGYPGRLLTGEIRR